MAGFLALAACIAAAGYWHYRIAAQDLRQQAHREIAAIGALKSGEIRQWRNDRLQAVTHLGRDPLIAVEVEALLHSTAAGNAMAGLLGRLRAEHNDDPLANALLVALDGTMLLAARDINGTMDPATRRAMDAALAGRTAVLSDLYRSANGRFWLDAVGAVRNAAGQPLAVAILRSDAGAYLYPLIESWPTPSRTAETFIVERSGDDAIWLNNARHRPNSALAFRQPLTNATLPAAQAVLGRRGAFEGRDYRNVAVLADLRPIEGSPWFMVAKIDLDEVLAETRDQVRAIALVVTLFVLLTGVVFAYGYQSQQGRLLQERYLLQRNTLIDLVKSDALNSDDLVTAFGRIIEAAAATLGVARVSVWRYTGDRTAIACDDLYEQASGRHSSGAQLPAATCPAYFEALAHATVMVADDARRDPRTSELSAGYLTPLGITSMLDAPIHLGGAVEGVLCHEHVGPPRRWSADESAFAVAVANVASLVLEGWQRRRAEAGLRLQSTALNAAASAIVITDRSGAIEWVNQAFTALTGYSQTEAIGRNPRDLVSSGVHDAKFFANLWDTVLAGRVWRGEITNRRKDGTRYVEGMSITPVKGSDGEITHFVAIKRDLTEDKQLQAQLLQSQKMEVVGRLAGGIAHDFNNLLTVINGTAELVGASLPDGDPTREDLREIELAGLRAAALTRQLLAFSRKQVLAPEVLDLAVVLTGLRSMLQRMIGEDVTLAMTSAAGCWVRADRGQMEQVVTNLVVNARDAMPHGGTIAVSTRDADAGTVLLEVLDTGSGMDEATLAHIFEPFFTTKEQGKGTGLGLATVFGIVRGSGGTIAVKSSPGHGSTFSIRLPRVAAEAPASTASVSPAAAGHETILVVEDEDQVRQMTERMLVKSGYRVLTAGNGEQAMRVLEDGSQPLRAMLTDVVMPGMSGPELAAYATEVRPDLGIIYMSGHTDNDALRQSVFTRSAHFIGKPFAREDLARVIRETLDSTAPAGSA